MLFLPSYLRYIVPHRSNRFIKRNTNTLMRYTLSSSSYTAPKRARTHPRIDGLKCPEYKYYKNNDNNYSGYRGKGGRHPHDQSLIAIHRHPHHYPLSDHCGGEKEGIVLPFGPSFLIPFYFVPPRRRCIPPLFLAASTSNANTSIPPPPDFVIIRVQ